MNMKSLKTQFIGAIAMVLVAAIAMGSSTYAWFAMNNEVTASNMMVQAVAEKGLLINEVAAYDSTTWDELATAAQTSSSASKLYPTSTHDGTAWFHAASKKSNDEAQASSSASGANLINGTDSTKGYGYETLPTLAEITAMSDTATPGTKAARSTMGRNASDSVGYYVKYTYYLKGASGSSLALGVDPGKTNVTISSVTATTSDSASANLDKALRVGIQIDSGAFYIYAPYATSSSDTSLTLSYYVGSSHTATTAKYSTEVTYTDMATLPAAGTNGTPVYVYLWYEGEDVNCMSDNATAATLDNVSVTVNFKLDEVPTSTP